MSSSSKPSLCVFANFFIDNEERLQRMKDSFFSFRDVNPEEYRVNIRGRFKEEAAEFLRGQIGEILRLFFLESSKGWFQDSKEVMKEASADYVFFWIEDHLCLIDPNDIRLVLSEMVASGADQLIYSWYHDGVRKKYEMLVPSFCGAMIRVWRIDKERSAKIRQHLGADFYIVSAPSIMRLNFFFKILMHKRPYLRRWPKHLPFDFEKLSKDEIAAVIFTALPEIELFAAIDDDHGQVNYSLISRGLYPNRLSREELKRLEFDVAAPPISRFRSLIPQTLRPVFRWGCSVLRRLRWSVDRVLRR